MCVKLNHNGSPFTNEEGVAGSGRWEVGPENWWKVGGWLKKNRREMGG